MTPTARTLKLLRGLGWYAGVVEKWNSFAKIRQDLFGFIDIVAFGKDGTHGIQATSKTNISSRKKKILANEIAPEWLKCGNKISIIGWAKSGIGRKTWQPTVVQITLEDFNERL